MNVFTASRFDEKVTRLALGVEVVDAGRGSRAAHPVSVVVDGAPFQVTRHESCVHVLVYAKDLYRPSAGRTSVALRFQEAGRRFVPRRLEFPLRDPVVVADADDDNPAAGDPALLGAGRVRTVHLFPGAAYDLPASATGLRGRARRADGSPVRWVRVEARRPALADGSPGPVVGRAQGDDRGEFLLVLRPEAIGIEPLDRDLRLSLPVTVTAQASDPAASAAARTEDPLWDLWAQPVTGSGPSDPVSRGETLPPAYTVTRSQAVPFTLGRLSTSEVPPFVF